jgi:hypothetical protein
MENFYSLASLHLLQLLIKKLFTAHADVSLFQSQQNIYVVITTHIIFSPLASHTKICQDYNFMYNFSFW